MELDNFGCCDVTYIWTGNRRAYLAVVIDLFACKPTGWAISYLQDSELAAKAFTMTFEFRGRPDNVMLHLDQGSYYTSGKFKQQLW